MKILVFFPLNVMESFIHPGDGRFTLAAAAAAAKSLQSCLILCDPIDSSPPGSAIPSRKSMPVLSWVVPIHWIGWAS